jgi:hypothetical protein
MSDKTVNLIVVYNPLNVSERVEEKLAWGLRKPLAAYLEGLPEDVCWGVCVNSEPIERENWDHTYLSPDDFLTLVPVPEGGGGGGGGKMVLRLVAMVAVAAVAWYASGLVAESMMAAGPMLDGTAGYLTTSGMIASAGTGLVVSRPGTTIFAILPEGIAA